jgi:Fis family transcriptional regulator, factor for inversion stimulation protein
MQRWRNALGNGAIRVLGENVVTNTTSQKRTQRKKATRASKVGVRNKTLSTLTDEALHNYFTRLNGHKPGDLYQLVLGEVEKPLFSAVLDYTNGNQSEAAEILGINRGTLRKKLKTYKLMRR